MSEELSVKSTKNEILVAYNELLEKVQENERSDKKLAVESALNEREKSVKQKEEEFASLKARVEGFPAEIEHIKQETEKTVRNKIEFQYKHSAEISAKEIDGERKLFNQKITALEDKIKEQNERINQLTEKVNESSSQVQNIAIKAIEGASASASGRIINVGNSEKTGRRGETSDN